MKFASINTIAGPSYGVVTPVGVAPVSEAWRQRFPTLRDAIAANALDGVAAAGQEIVAFDEADFLPLIPNPGKVICVGKNYAAHAAESGHKPAAVPSLFARFTDTLVGHGHSLVKPVLSSSFDFEGELAVIIGRGGRHIPEAEALDHIIGYTCFQDGSLRDFQFDHSLLAGKNFASTGGLGPVLTTADEVGDPQKLEVVTRLNGETVQHGYTRDMIFSCAWLIAYISGFIDLVPGDVIATGTPEGVGFARQPPLWLNEGDTVEVEVPGVGLLRNSVVSEAGGRAQGL
jgi:2-keto-4-pentenoate hydratase/2-oxohepta-3-ene-1,7-dioic acid hydratase in catechol pathway